MSDRNLICEDLGLGKYTVILESDGVRSAYTLGRYVETDSVVDVQNHR